MGNMNGIKKKYVILVLRVYPVVSFSSRLLLWLALPVGEAAWKTSFLTLRGVFQRSEGFCPQRPIMCVHLSEQLMPLVSCRSQTQRILTFFSLRTWRTKSPFISHNRAWPSRDSWHWSDARASFGILRQHEDRLIIIENSKVTIW